MMEINGRLLILIMIVVKLNGEDFTCDEHLNFFELLELIGIDSRSVAIELNLEILPKSMWETTKICQNDKIELVQFVGGGR